MLLRGRTAAAGKDIKAIIDADMKFHGAIYAGWQNPLMAQSALIDWGHVRRVMGSVLQSSELRQSVWNEHEDIARAIAAGKAELEVGPLRACNATSARDERRYLLFFGHGGMIRGYPLAIRAR